MYSILFTFLQLTDICFYFWVIVTSTALKFLCKYLKTCFSILWIYTKGVKLMGGICGSAGKRIRLQCSRLGFDPWVGKICWRREKLLFQYSGLQNSMDCVVHGVAKSQKLLSDFHFHGNSKFNRLRNHQISQRLHYFTFHQ